MTAQKRSERLQSIPMSVTAFDAAKLSRLGIQSVLDVARHTPGLTVVSSGPGQNILIMRGISSTAGTAGTVGYYLDETPIAASSNASLLSLRGVIDPALFDIGQVEVLRGPQGTLYGSSSMGGTVKYLSRQADLKKLTFETDSALSSTKGGGRNWSAGAVLNIPLVEDRLAARLTVFEKYQDGFIPRYGISADNYLRLPVSGPVQENVNTEKTSGFRLMLKWQLADDLTLSGSWLQQRSFLGAPFQIDQPPGSTSALLQTRLLPEPSTQVSSIANISVRKQFEQFELLSSTSYYDRNVSVDEDSSKVIYYFFSPKPQTYIYPVIMQGNYLNREFTQELRLTSDWKGPWQFIGGAYYHHVNAPLASQIPVTPGYNAAFGTQYASFFKGARQATVSETALFGEASYKITPQLSVNLGLRSFRVNQSFAQQVDGEFVGGVASGVTGSSSDSGLNPKLNLSWQASPDLLLFATASKGYRPGGPNNPAPVAVCGKELASLNLNASQLQRFGADSIWNYELGAKSRWLHGSLTANASLYSIDWNDVQQQIVLQCGFNITANFGSASSRGAELELTYQPNKLLELNLMANIGRTRLNNDVPGTPARNGDSLLDVPNWSMAAAVEYTPVLAHGMPAYLRLDYTYIGKANFLFDRSSPFYQRAAYGLVNLKWGVRQISADKRLGLGFFIDNVFNKIGQTGLPVAISADLPDTRRIAVTRPRTFGMTLRYAM
ncbi:TonB-dependent receptor [Undibacterium sp. JH2W]|uniref:TonB-dependent receptor n=1 Tax=Undibacterium sp. JH2W TaxID=3413037 RepID=UPI003BF3C7C9